MFTLSEMFAMVKMFSTSVMFKIPCASTFPLHLPNLSIARVQTLSRSTRPETTLPTRRMSPARKNSPTSKATLESLWPKRLATQLGDLANTNRPVKSRQNLMSSAQWPELCVEKQTLSKELRSRGGQPAEARTLSPAELEILVLAYAAKKSSFQQSEKYNLQAFAEEKNSTSTELEIYRVFFLTGIPLKSMENLG